MNTITFSLTRVWCLTQAAAGQCPHNVSHMLYLAPYSCLYRCTFGAGMKKLLWVWKGGSPNSDAWWFLFSVLKPEWSVQVWCLKHCFIKIFYNFGLEKQEKSHFWGNPIPESLRHSIHSRRFYDVAAVFHWQQGQIATMMPWIDHNQLHYIILL